MRRRSLPAVSRSRPASARAGGPPRLLEPSPSEGGNRITDAVRRGRSFGKHGGEVLSTFDGNR